MASIPPLPTAATAGIVGAITDTQSAPASAALLERCYGIVQSIQPGTPNTLTVTLEGATQPTAGITYLTSYSPTVGDKVVCSRQGSDVLVEGAQSSGSGPSGGPVPVGTLLAFTAVPVGAGTTLLLCDGSAFSGVTYPALAAHLGGTRLPDARGVVLMGAGVNGIVLGTRDAVGGSEAHAHTGAAHTHTGAAHVHGSGGPHSHPHSHPLSPSYISTQATGGSISAPAGTNYPGVANTQSDSTATDPGNTASTTPGAGGSTTPGVGGSYGSGPANVPPNLGCNVYIRAL